MGQRVLVFGMPSGGTSVVAWFLAQKPNSLAILDAWALGPAKSDIPSHLDCVLKVTANTLHSLGETKARFQPTHTVLVIRNPVEVSASAKRKEFIRTERGTVEEKFSAFDRARATHSWDSRMYYEHFRHGFVPASLRDWNPLIARDTPRSVQAVVDFTIRHCQWAAENWGKTWGRGVIYEDWPVFLTPGPLRFLL